MTDKTITILDDDQSPLADPILETEEVSSEGESPVEPIADTEELETDEFSEEMDKLLETMSASQDKLDNLRKHFNSLMVFILIFH